MFLGVDGGGTKTAYALIDTRGELRASRVDVSVSHLAEGFERAEALLVEGVRGVLAAANVDAAEVGFAFFGLPAHGEDSATTSRLDALPRAALSTARFRCGNDMIGSWAGSLGGADGISVIAGTGSMAYGEFEDRTARAGGWGELIGDEGSAYWIAREGMNLFSRMSDGRAPRGALHALVRERLSIDVDLDLCARIYGEAANTRGAFAQFARLVHEAAQAGDQQAREIFKRAGEELANTVLAVRRSLDVAPSIVVPASYSGGAFAGAQMLVEAFMSALAALPAAFECREPLYPPVVGAALYAARLAGAPLAPEALSNLQARCAASELPR
jgi:N-acetylglucosamine kinase-like BadF-type ATPase